MIYEAQRKRIGGLALDSHSCRETDSTYLPMLKARRLHRTWVLSNVKRVQPLAITMMTTQAGNVTLTKEGELIQGNDRTVKAPTTPWSTCITLAPPF